MPVKNIWVYTCDICSSVYDPNSLDVSESSGDVCSSMRIDGLYKPEEHAKISCICKNCSNKIVEVVQQLKKAKLE